MQFVYPFPFSRNIVLHYSRFSLKKNNIKIPFLVKEYALSIAEEDFDASH